MKKIVLITLAALVCSLSTTLSFAGGGHDAVLDHANFKMNDKASLQRGASTFVNYCLSCHSASYARYKRVFEDLEIPAHLQKEFMYTTDKSGDLMKATMPEKDAKQWFGVAPPDLTLVARVRGTDWLYTYLRAFYQDENSPSGWNNSLFEHVAMPHALYELQGVQHLVGKVDAHDAEGSNGTEAEGSHGAASHDGDSSQKIVGDAVFELVHPGKLSPDEFDTAMVDLTAFLQYLGEPAQLKRPMIGVLSIAFLIILMLLCIMLKKEFWRDVH